jgi:hypothetical protein
MRILSSFGQHSSFWLKGSIEQKDDEKGKKMEQGITKMDKKVKRNFMALKVFSRVF